MNSLRKIRRLASPLSTLFPGGGLGGLSEALLQSGIEKSVLKIPEERSLLFRMRIPFLKKNPFRVVAQLTPESGARDRNAESTAARNIPDRQTGHDAEESRP